MNTCSTCVHEFPGCGAINGTITISYGKVVGCDDHYCARRDTVVVDQAAEPVMPCLTCRECDHVGKVLGPHCCLKKSDSCQMNNWKYFQPRREEVDCTKCQSWDSEDSMCSYGGRCVGGLAFVAIQPRQERDSRAEIEKCQSCRFVGEDGPCKFVSECEANSHYQSRQDVVDNPPCGERCANAGTLCRTLSYPKCYAPRPAADKQERSCRTCGHFTGPGNKCLSDRGDGKELYAGYPNGGYNGNDGKGDNRPCLNFGTKVDRWTPRPAAEQPRQEARPAADKCDSFAKCGNAGKIDECNEWRASCGVYIPVVEDKDERVERLRYVLANQHHPTQLSEAAEAVLAVVEEQRIEIDIAVDGVAKVVRRCSKAEEERDEARARVKELEAQIEKFKNDNIFILDAGASVVAHRDAAFAELGQIKNERDAALLRIKELEAEQTNAKDLISGAEQLVRERDEARAECDRLKNETESLREAYDLDIRHNKELIAENAKLKAELAETHADLVKRVLEEEDKRIGAEIERDKLKAELAQPQKIVVDGVEWEADSYRSGKISLVKNGGSWNWLDRDGFYQGHNTDFLAALAAATEAVKGG